MGPVPAHVEAARASGIDAVLGDARQLPFDDDTFDAALLLGPLYHLGNLDDRLTALREATRVVRGGGFVFAAAIPRFVAFAAPWLGRPSGPVPQTLLDLLEHGTPPPDLLFPAGHFHTAEELADEMTSAGLEMVSVQGVEGPGGLFLEVRDVAETELLEAGLTLARAAGDTPGIRDISGHLMAVGRVAISVA